ncbi:hypothetical protein FF1_022321 [Malus domestica]
MCLAMVSHCNFYWDLAVLKPKFDLARNQIQLSAQLDPLLFIWVRALLVHSVKSLNLVSSVTVVVLFPSLSAGGVVVMVFATRATASAVVLHFPHLILQPHAH